jgi:tRNA (guanine-N7-)-methyltransferase
LPKETPPPIRYRALAPGLPEEGAIDLDALVPGEGPLELDIGFGRGASVFERAAAAREARILGIEVKAKHAFVVDERRKKRGLDRVRVFAADARDVLSRAVPEGCLDKVFLHFPDPWWKKRHAKRRVLGAEVLDDLARLVRSGGTVYVQTDVEDRATLYRDLLAAHEAFTLEGDDGYIEANPFGARSNREIRAAEDGLPIFRILAHRR